MRWKLLGRKTWLQGSGQALLLSPPRVGIIPQSISWTCWHLVQLLLLLQHLQQSGEGFKQWGDA